MKLKGAWNTINKITKDLEKLGKQSMKEGLIKVGLHAEKRAKQHISKQDLNWKPLNQKYRNAKERKGFSTNILVRSSAYFQAITSFFEDDMAKVGVKKVARDKEGKEIANIAAVHEFGSSKAKIPARPLWQPVLKETTEWIEKEQVFEKIIMNKINRHL